MESCVCRVHLYIYIAYTYDCVVLYYVILFIRNICGRPHILAAWIYIYIYVDTYAYIYIHTYLNMNTSTNVYTGMNRCVHIRFRQQHADSSRGSAGESSCELSA